MLILTFSACGSQSAENPDSSSNVSDVPQADSDVPQADSVNTEEEKPSSDSSNEVPERKTLVVYYSATGNTKEAAGTGNWLDGRRFSSVIPETDVTEWIESLGY